MRNKFVHNTGSSQLWPVLLLLAVAVILPTVCLLWFMTQAVKNERLAVRQKLVDMYSKRAKTSFIDYSTAYRQKDKKLPDDYFDIFNITQEAKYQGLLIYNETSELVYPALAFDDAIKDSTPALKNAWRIEFVENDYPGAAQAYSELADSNEVNLWGTALTAKARCLKKAGKLTEAAEAALSLAWPSKGHSRWHTHIGRARIMLMKLYQAIAHPDFFTICQKTLDSRLADLQINSELRVFLLQQAVNTTQDVGISDRLDAQLKQAKRIIAAEKLSLSVARIYQTAPPLKDWPAETFQRIETIPPVYGIHYTSSDKHVLALITLDKMSEFWRSPADDMDDEMVFCSVLDDTGQIVAGRPEIWLGQKLSQGQLFLTLSLGKFFPDWKVELYFRHGIFTAAAKRQQIVYLWIVALVIGMMVLISGLAAKAILRQARLNRLKNDFIATITHELKTPLSSMRVLVDTLLEGNYNDQQQATEYLQLISKENVRLSRLIDNFLTFSRMERNKQAFEIVRTSPAEIATAAADAVQTKFNQENCKFTVSIDDNLPVISADRDAMVTVLVNLLDNAYKYSLHDKQIELKVYAENQVVCFSVKDSGIGMTHRQTKRVFNRFYQADSSLSRQADGTGLGLSIVKFIIDAHKGQIAVESKPGKGSEFIVKLPTV